MVGAAKGYRNVKVVNFGHWIGRKIRVVDKALAQGAPSEGVIYVSGYPGSDEKIVSLAFSSKLDEPGRGVGSSQEPPRAAEDSAWV